MRYIFFPKYSIPVAIFLLAVLVVPIQQMGMLSKMPGDVGDARLNNYFLENIYRYIVGKSDSLWHLGIFWPFPYTLGFSDNHFGSAPVYILARLMSIKPDTAFQLWFLAAYAFNFCASYYMLLKLGINPMPACIGAFIYTFSIPALARAGHAQLQYRFGAPLAILYLIQFFNHGGRGAIKNLLMISLWLTLQLYCSIYLGFFTGLLLLALMLSYLFLYKEHCKRNTLGMIFVDLRSSWKAFGKCKKTLLISYIILCLGSIYLLFYPYIQVSKLYQITRDWTEISTMLPRIQSYLISDHSLFGRYTTSEFFKHLPMRHEHQMFPGLINSFLFLMAFVYFYVTIKSFSDSVQSESSIKIIKLMSGSLIILGAFTLNFKGYSLWYFVHSLPLFSAMRAMTRIDLILLLPFSILITFFLNEIYKKYRWGNLFIIAIVLPLIVIESSHFNMYTSSKFEWRERLNNKILTLNNFNAEKKVIFFASNYEAAQYKPELDAMWAANYLDMKTMNGYSGAQPKLPGFDHTYGTACSVLPQRISSFIYFSEINFGFKPNYQHLISQVLPIGFVDCNEDWWNSPPKITSSTKPYSADDFLNITFNDGEILSKGDNIILKFIIQNYGNLTISAKSSIGKPIRVSWRYLDEFCKPYSTWDLRRDIPEDIEPGGGVLMNIIMDNEKLKISCGVEVTIVQEFEFWGHDVGFLPLTVYNPKLKLNN